MQFDALKSGQSVQEREIKTYISNKKAKKFIYLIGGVHGDEPEGVHVVTNIFNWLKTTKINLPLIVVPKLNPDSFVLDQRQNANNVDLNRNLPSENWQSDCDDNRYHPGLAPLSEPENKFIDSLFKKYDPGIIISIHAWKPLINYNCDKALPIASFLSSHNSYPCDKSIGYPTPGSMGNYAPERYGATIITFECTPIDELPLEKIWQENETAFKELFKSNLFENFI